MKCFLCGEFALDSICGVCSIKYRKLSYESLVLLKYGKFCYYCRTPLNQKNLTFDHRIPKILGGPDSIWNLVPACKRCNEEKGSLTDVEFLKQKNIKKRRESFWKAGKKNF